MGNKILIKKVFDIIKSLFKIFIISAIAIISVIGILYAYFWSMDNLFKNILPFMSRAVLSNFILFAVILVAALWFGAKAPSQMQKMQENITETIETSETAKNEAETKLNKMEENMAHLSKEIEAILTESEEKAKLVGEKIIEDANKTALAVKDNNVKAIENNRVLLKNDLIKRASHASIEIAKSHILEELNKNSELHNRLIDESIEKIEGVDL